MFISALRVDSSLDSLVSISDLRLLADAELGCTEEFYVDMGNAAVELPLVVGVQVDAIDLTAHVLIVHSTRVSSIPSNSETTGWEQAASTDVVGPGDTETTDWE